MLDIKTIRYANPVLAFLKGFLRNEQAFKEVVFSDATYVLLDPQTRCDGGLPWINDYFGQRRREAKRQRRLGV